MESLHQKLVQKSAWYRFWHNHPRHNIAHWAIFVFIGLFFTAAIIGRITDKGIFGQLRGLFTKASTTITVNAGDNLQDAINSAQCGYIIELQAGATWDTGSNIEATFHLPNKNCTAGTPITIRSSAHSSLPMGRISLAHASNMPRLRVLAQGGHVFLAAPGAGHWILDGLELTDNITSAGEAHSLLDYSAAGVHDMTVTRSYMHQKESNPDYSRNLIRAMQWEGRNLVFRWNHAGPFHGFYSDNSTLMNTAVILAIGAPGPTLIEDNHMEAWYTAIFLGGGDTGAAHTATISNATPTQATFSDLTALTVGTMVRFNAGGACTPDSPNCKVAKVTGITGNVVSYIGAGSQALTTAPDMPGQAAWCVGDECMVNDVTVRKNTFYIDPAFAESIAATNLPKGSWEVKSVNRMTVEGNRFSGFPGGMAWALLNQSGTAPWTTVKHVIIRNNWYAPDSYPAYDRIMALISLDDGNGRSATPGEDIQIYNNLVENVNGFLQPSQGTDWQIHHNTVINTKPGGNNFMFNAGPMNNVTLRDNISAYQTYGMTYYPTNFVNSTARNNVVLNNLNIEGITTGVWGPGSVLSPIFNSMNQVGFTDMASDNYRLASNSPYKNAATDGTDPGVNMDTLLAALSSAPPLPPPPPPPPVGPTPSITSFQLAAKTSTSATIFWVTDQDTTATIAYGKSRTALSQTASDNSSNTTHQINLTNLTPATIYYYKITAMSPNGSATTIIASFRTR